MNNHHFQQALPHVQKLSSSKGVTLLLGTDAHIGKEGVDQETRVCMTPAQIWKLKEWLKDAGVSLNFYVIAGAGLRSGYTDQDYRDVDGQVIQEGHLPNLRAAVDVVHALKEPCSYEALIPGSFIRIGALHTGIFDATSGIATLLLKQNFCAVFDGSVIGNFSFKLDGGYPIPVRSSMSVFAGSIAADIVLSNLKQSEKSHKIRIVGGGIVGISAVNRLLEKTQNSCVEIDIIESRREKCEALHQMYKDNSFVQIKEGNHVSGEDLREASGLILATFSPGCPTSKVVDVHCLQEMREKACVIDVSADEGGSIACPGGENIVQAIKGLGKDIQYICDTHMPRRYPQEASEAHGKAILPYLAVLLYLSAREGSGVQAVKYIKQRDSSTQVDYFEALIRDLQNGLAFTGPRPILLNKNVVKSTESVLTFLDKHNILYDIYS
jgi:alanine dehydrogenase